MKKDYELVIFDLDGTLLDTSRGILAAISQALQTLQIPNEGKICAQDFIGPPIEKALNKHLHLDGEVLARASKAFRLHYAQEHLLKATPYEGIEELLSTLRREGYGRAVATYKREAVAERLLWHCGLEKHLNIIHGTNDAQVLSKTDLILRCIEDYGLTDRKRVVMIGDTEEDALGAAQAGVDFIAVTYGFGFTKEDALRQFPCIGIANSTQDVLCFIKGEATPPQTNSSI